VEIPTLERFESQRAMLIEQMRQNPPFAPPDGTAALLADAQDAAELYRTLRESLTASCLTEEALELLRDHDIYAEWRRPAMEPVRESASTYARRRHLVSWERKPVGEFLRDLLRFQAPSEPLDDLFAARVARQMDQLALRSVPLAPGPFGAASGSGHPQGVPLQAADWEGPSMPGAGRGTPGGCPAASAASVVFAIPPSLGCHHGDAGAGALLPSDSMAGSLATWFGPSPNAVHLHLDEADLAACVVTIAGLSPAAILKALGSDEALEARSSEQGARSAERRRGRSEHEVRAMPQALRAEQEPPPPRVRGGEVEPSGRSEATT
jgi:hypothetical protein